MLKLNYKSGVPICDQIVNGFVRMKALGLVESGEQLPSVRALAMELGVNPNTIQKAYQILETNGIIYSVKGKGSFISDDAAADTAVIMSAKRDFPILPKKLLAILNTQLYQQEKIIITIHLLKL